MRPLDRLTLAALTLLACRRAHAPRRPVDPRARFATACEDPRFVTAAPREIAGLRSALPTAAFARTHSLYAGATDTGVVVTDGAHPFALGPAAPDARVVSTAIDGHFVLAWRAPSGVRAAVLDDDLGHPHTLDVPFCVGDPAVAGYGTSALIACVRHVTGVADTLSVTRVRASGATDPIAEIRCPRGECRSPSITRLGDTAWVAFIGHDSGPESIYTSRVDLAHKRAAEASLFARPAATVGAVAIAAGWRTVALAWTDISAGSFALYASSMTLAGARSVGAQRLSIRHNGEAPSLAWDGAAFGIAWSEPVGGGNDRSYFALLDPTGNRIGTQLRVYVPDDHAASHPSLAFTGRGYDLVYSTADGVVLERQTGPLGCDAPP